MRQRPPGPTVVLAEFETPGGMLAAARLLTRRGWGRVDTHSPYPVEGTDEALDASPSPLPWVVLLCGFTGVAVGYLVQWYCNAVDYPINVGGRPLHSWPAFIPITFETGVLMGGISAFLGTLFFCRLPYLHHPVHRVEEFRRATLDRFFTSLEMEGAPPVPMAVVMAELRALGASQLSVIEEER